MCKAVGVLASKSHTYINHHKSSPKKMEAIHLNLCKVKSSNLVKQKTAAQSVDVDIVAL